MPVAFPLPFGPPDQFLCRAVGIEKMFAQVTDKHRHVRMALGIAVKAY